jgi:hypothetical protein
VKLGEWIFFLKGCPDMIFESYILGIQEYGKRESKTVRFDRSFGFNFQRTSYLFVSVAKK